MIQNNPANARVCSGLQVPMAVGILVLKILSLDIWASVVVTFHDKYTSLSELTVL